MVLDHVTSGLDTVLTWVGTVITAIFTSNGKLFSLAPLVAIGISISAILLGVKIIKSMVWGS